MATSRFLCVFLPAVFLPDLSQESDWQNCRANKKRKKKYPLCVCFPFIDGENECSFFSAGFFWAPPSHFLPSHFFYFSGFLQIPGCAWLFPSGLPWPFLRSPPPKEETWYYFLLPFNLNSHARTSSLLFHESVRRQNNNEKRQISFSPLFYYNFSRQYIKKTLKAFPGCPPPPYNKRLLNIVVSLEPAIHFAFWGRLCRVMFSLAKLRLAYWKKNFYLLF